MKAVFGRVAPGFEAVREVFAALYAEGLDDGSAVAVYSGEQLVVDLWGGDWQEHSLQLVASSSKFAESLCVAWLVDRGLLHYSDPIAQHWPAFAQGGDGRQDPDKAQVTVRQLLMHRAGLPICRRKLTAKELFDLDARAAFLAGQSQVSGLFEAELASFDWTKQAQPQAYHGVTRGLYVGELVRRVDPKRRSIGQLWQDEVAQPLGLNFWIGLPEAEDWRLAPIRRGSCGVDQQTAAEREFVRKLADSNSLTNQSLNCLEFAGEKSADLSQIPAFRRCELASSSGIGDARALAAMAGLVARGGRLGERAIFTRQETLQDFLLCPEKASVDQILEQPMHYTQGGVARFVASDACATVNFGWQGAGGSRVRCVPELAMGFGYVTSTTGGRMAMHDPRANGLLHSALECAWAQVSP